MKHSLMLCCASSWMVFFTVETSTMFPGRDRKNSGWVVFLSTTRRKRSCLSISSPESPHVVMGMWIWLGRLVASMMMLCCVLLNCWRYSWKNFLCNDSSPKFMSVSLILCDDTSAFLYRIFRMFPSYQFFVCIIAPVWQIR